MTKNIAYFEVEGGKARKFLCLTLFKHLLRCVKQLEDPEMYFDSQLVSFDVYQQEGEYQELMREIKNYSVRYEHEYLEVLKNTDISIIRAVNSKFPELSCNMLLTHEFYLAYCQYLRETLRAANHAVSAQEGEPSHPRVLAAQYQAVDSLYTYLNMVELKFRVFQVSKGNKFSNFNQKVVMDYRMTLFNQKDYFMLRGNLKSL
jgi:hypothetical protein